MLERISEIGDSILEWFCENIMQWVLIAAGIFLFILIGVVVYESIGPTVTLSKAEWECTETAKVRHQVLMPVGKVLMPTTTDDDECVQYRRKIAR